MVSSSRHDFRPVDFLGHLKELKGLKMKSAEDNFRSFKANNSKLSSLNVADSLNYLKRTKNIRT